MKRLSLTDEDFKVITSVLSKQLSRQNKLLNNPPFWLRKEEQIKELEKSANRNYTLLQKLLDFKHQE